MQQLPRTPVAVWFVYLLTLLFIGLKLTGHITWSWFWVLSPLILMFGFVAILIVVALLFLFVAFLLDDNKRF